MAVMFAMKFFWVYNNFVETRLRSFKVLRKSEDPILDQSKIFGAECHWTFWNVLQKKKKKM